MKNLDNKGLSIIGILLIVGALVITAGGVVVWKEKVFPVVPAIPTATPTPIPTPPSTETPPLHKELGKTWVQANPVQCLGNPWQRDWRQSHGHDVQYPYVEEDKIIREYYQKQGITIFDIKTRDWGTNVCAGCACPAGYTLFLLVSDSNVQKMIDLGFRAVGQ